MFTHSPRTAPCSITRVTARALLPRRQRITGLTSAKLMLGRARAAHAKPPR